MNAYTTKALAYAYPTSTNAKRFGHYNTGCWTVDLVDPKTWKKKVLKAFADKAEAQAFMATLDYPVDRYSH